MGVLWGINRSMARVHALLIVSHEPIGLEEVCEELEISRGNASMCLKELRNWGVARRVHISGDRRDYYVTESDVWSMFFKILVQRKKREFDPALQTVREALTTLDDSTNSDVGARLSQMEDLLSTIDSVTERFLIDEGSSRSMLRFLIGMSK
ncbi:MAG: ArsR family transcriptional regulator [Proteobacteria bacterium]|nr:ArsR family transcriptional regulator [Pseudomonadota bacterium]